jgi:transcriptional regulator with XRE-family HTH domain
MATHGNDLVREARKRAGLTQRALAELGGTTQSAIARLESGRTRPAFDDVLRLVRLCGFDVEVRLVERESAEWMQAQELLKRSPSERLDLALKVTRQVEELRRAARSA